MKTKLSRKRRGRKIITYTWLTAFIVIMFMGIVSECRQRKLQPTVEDLEDRETVYYRGIDDQIYTVR